MVYLSILIIFLINLLINSNIIFVSNLKFKNFSLFFSILLLIAVSSFKSLNVGNDTLAYFQVFNDLINYNFGNLHTYVTHFEYGYLLYTKTILIFTESFTIFNIITYSIIYIPYFFLIKKFSYNFSYSVLLLFCFNFCSFICMKFI